MDFSIPQGLTPEQAEQWKIMAKKHAGGCVLFKAPRGFTLSTKCKVIMPYWAVQRFYTPFVQPSTATDCQTPDLGNVTVETNANSVSVKLMDHNCNPVGDKNRCGQDSPSRYGQESLNHNREGEEQGQMRSGHDQGDSNHSSKDDNNPDPRTSDSFEAIEHSGLALRFKKSQKAPDFPIDPLGDNEDVEEMDCETSALDKAPIQDASSHQKPIPGIPGSKPSIRLDPGSFASRPDLPARPAKRRKVDKSSMIALRLNQPLQSMDVEQMDHEHSPANGHSSLALRFKKGQNAPKFSDDSLDDNADVEEMDCETPRFINAHIDESANTERMDHDFNPAGGKCEQVQDNSGYSL